HGESGTDELLVVGQEHTDAIRHLPSPVACLPGAARLPRGGGVLTQRQLGDDLETSASSRTDTEGTAVDGDPFPHAVDAPALTVARRGGAPPVVGHANPHGVRTVGHLDPCASAWAGVPDRVRQ